MKKNIIFSFLAIVIVAIVAAILGDAHSAMNASTASMGLIGLGGAQQRATFDKIKAKNPTKTVVPGFLRVEREIKNGLTTYSFNFTRDTGSTNDTEVKLDRTESFVITQVGLFLAKKDTALPNCEVLQTYPNKTVFADGNKFKADYLEAIYNGYLSLKVKSKVYMEALGLDLFRHVGAMAQSSAATFSEKNSYDGFINMVPNIKLSGDDPHSIDITVPVKSAAIVENDVANMSNHLVMIARGFLIKQ